jgi:hypothetical protein
MKTFVLPLIMTALCTMELISSVAFDLIILALQFGLTHMAFPPLET